MKVRIRRPRPDGRQLKTGVMVVENEHGTYYRLGCERCDTPLKLMAPPLAGQDTFCRECQNIADIGKPETKLVHKWGTLAYETPCDKCGETEQTSFLPKRVRDFFCNSCMKESRVPAPDAPESAPSPDSQAGTLPKSEATPQGTHVEEQQRHVRVSSVKRIKATCSVCRCTVVLKFQPNSKRPFLCSKCFHKQQEEYRSEKPKTRILFNIECNDCGRQETLDFIPTFPERALCSSCFKKMQRRKNDSNR